MCLTEWRPECVSASLAFDGRQEHEELLAALEDHLTSNNLFYAVKVRLPCCCAGCAAGCLGG